MLSFYSDGPSLSPAEACSYSVTKFMLKKNKKLKRGRGSGLPPPQKKTPTYPNFKRSFGTSSPRTTAFEQFKLDFFYCSSLYCRRKRYLDRRPYIPPSILLFLLQFMSYVQKGASYSDVAFTFFVGNSKFACNCK